MLISDWSSDVCSSDLPDKRARSGGMVRVRRERCVNAVASMQRACRRGLDEVGRQHQRGHRAAADRRADIEAAADRLGGDRKSVVQGRRVSVRVELGGRLIINKKRKRNSKRKST